MNHFRFLTGLILLALLAFGCTPREAVGPTKHGKDANHVEDEDPPPHGGKLFMEPGHKYHGELLIDEKTKQATVYLFDDKVRDPVATKAETFTLTVKDSAPVSIILKPQRQDNDPPDTSSRFVGSHDRLEKPVDYEKVEISGSIGEKPFVFTLEK
jgi:hypothetical protein